VDDYSAMDEAAVRNRYHEEGGPLLQQVHEKKLCFLEKPDPPGNEPWRVPNGHCEIDGLKGRLPNEGSKILVGDVQWALASKTENAGELRGMNNKLTTIILE